MAEIDLDRARAAKERVKALLAGHPLVVGIGIARVGGSLGVKVNLSAPWPTGSTASTPPATIDGVPVRVEVVGTIHRR